MLLILRAPTYEKNTHTIVSFSKLLVHISDIRITFSKSCQDPLLGIHWGLWLVQWLTLLLHPFWLLLQVHLDPHVLQVAFWQELSSSIKQLLFSVKIGRIHIWLWQGGGSVERSCAVYNISYIRCEISDGQEKLLTETISFLFTLKHVELLCCQL